MNPMNNPRDYVHDFKLKQLYIRHNYIDTNIQNNICNNHVKSFRNFIALLIKKPNWNIVDINGISIDNLNNLMCFLNIYAMDQIIKYDKTGNETDINIEERMFDLFKRKNSDYGNSFEYFGKVGILVRLVDKLNRLIKLTDDSYSVQVSDESIKDTLEDLYNYTILTMISD